MCIDFLCPVKRQKHKCRFHDNITLRVNVKGRKYFQINNAHPSLNIKIHFYLKMRFIERLKFCPRKVWTFSRVDIINKQIKFCYYVFFFSLLFLLKTLVSFVLKQYNKNTKHIFNWTLHVHTTDYLRLC